MRLSWRISLECVYLVKLYPKTGVNCGGMNYWCGLAVIVAIYWKNWKKKSKGNFNLCHLFYVKFPLKAHWSCFDDVCPFYLVHVCLHLSRYMFLIIKELSCLGLWVVLWLLVGGAKFIVKQCLTVQVETFAIGNSCSSP